MRRLLTMLGVLFLVVLGGSAGALAQPRFATVTILHALPAFTADVYVNGELTLDGFEPETATNPLELAPGQYHIEIRPVGAPADSPPVLEGTAAISGGENLSIIAGFTGAGEQTLNVYANDLSPVKAGQTRLVVRHVAAAKPLDVRLDGRRILSRIVNGADVAKLIPAASHSVEFTQAGADGVTIGPFDLDVQEGTAHILYAVGSAEDGSLDVMTQTISSLQSNPSGILTGDGGLAETSRLPTYGIALMAASGTALVIAIAWLVRTRRSGDHSRSL